MKGIARTRMGPGSLGLHRGRLAVPCVPERRGAMPTGSCTVHRSRWCPHPSRVLHIRRRVSCRSARCRAPSLGLSQRSPLRRRLLGRVLPSDLAIRLRCSAATRHTCSVLVGSHHLDGLRHPRFPGLLHPGADHGVHRVSAPVNDGLAAHATLPHQCTHPPEPCSPRGSRTCVTAGLCPLAVHRAMRGSTSGPCSTGGSVTPADRGRSSDARCSPGLP